MKCWTDFQDGTGALDDFIVPEAEEEQQTEIKSPILGEVISLEQKRKSRQERRREGPDELTKLDIPFGSAIEKGATLLEPVNINGEEGEDSHYQSDTETEKRLKAMYPIKPVRVSFLVAILAPLLGIVVIPISPIFSLFMALATVLGLLGLGYFLCVAHGIQIIHPRLALFSAVGTLFLVLTLVVAIVGGIP